jgi:hypothetical protein
MPAIPDRDTLRLRAPDRRTPAEAVALARRELDPSRRPLAPTFADVRLRPADRRLASFRERYPGVAERFHPAVLWSIAHGHAQPAGKPTRRPCGWCMALAYTRQDRKPAMPALRVDPIGRLGLGDPCPSCQVALGWRPPAPPRPKSKPKPKHRTARSSKRPAARSSTRRRAAPADVGPATVAAAAAAAGRLSPKRAAENAAACRRMGMDPARYPHLTRAHP